MLLEGFVLMLDGLLWLLPWDFSRLDHFVSGTATQQWLSISLQEVSICMFWNEVPIWNKTTGSVQKERRKTEVSYVLQLPAAMDAGSTTNRLSSHSWEKFV